MKKWVYLFTEGNANMRELLGGKGANLAEMTNIGLPVPQGFTITTEACTQYYEDGREINEEIQGQINEYITKMEEITGKKFGDHENPLLVSVRSGARASMPGMMDTILNLGLNETVVNVIAEKSGNPRWAWDCYRRFIQMYSDVVMEVGKKYFEQLIDAMKEKKGVKQDVELTADDLKELAGQFKAEYKAKIGVDIYTDEIFMAWHYARYVERMAQTARFIYNVPLYVNAAMNSRERKPGEYPSAGPLAHLIDVWHCGAPNIDILAPDLYDDGFTDWVAQYKLHNNPLFIPEIRLTDNNGVRAFYIFGEHDAIGISPFSIEDGSDSSCSPLAQSYTKLKELMPLLTEYQGKGMMKGLLFSQKYKERIITDDDLSITCRHYFTLPWDSRATDGSTWPEGGGLILKLSKNEYIVAGSGIVLEFAKTSEKPGSEIRKQLGEDGFALSNEQIKTKKEKFQGMRCGIGHVDEVEVDKEGKFRYIRRLNGDQDHQGRHVRISVGEFKILYVQLYEYQ